MELYKEVFNAASIYNMLFINVTGVLEYPTLNDLEKGNIGLYQTWMNKFKDSTDEFYQNTAIEFPEYTKILAISYGSFYLENGLKRNFKKIYNEDEFIVLSTFFTDLQFLVDSESPYNVLCGDNITSFDIPMLIKRFLVHRNNFPDKKLPKILKEYLMEKKYESSIVDTRSVWKFNSLTQSSANTQDLYSNFLSLKKTTDLVENATLSKFYWSTSEYTKRFDFISLQSATKVNLAMQLMNMLREI